MQRNTDEFACRIDFYDYEHVNEQENFDQRESHFICANLWNLWMRSFKSAFIGVICG